MWTGLGQWGMGTALQNLKNRNPGKKESDVPLRLMPVYARRLDDAFIRQLRRMSVVDVHRHGHATSRDVYKFSNKNSEKNKKENADADGNTRVEITRHMMVVGFGSYQPGNV